MGMFSLGITVHAIEDKSDSLANRDQYELVIQRGKLLFTTKPDSGTASAACVSCHTIEPSDSFNWNPTAYEIAKTIPEYDLAGFGELIAFPFGSDRLMEAHDGYDYSEKELNEMRFFLSTLIDKSPVHNAQKRDRFFLLYIFLGVIFLLGITDLFIVKKVYYRWIHWIMIFGSLTGFFFLIADDVFGIGLQRGYKPTQVLKFSHQLHCTENQINCYYCHSSARHTHNGGFPSVGTCMNCHTLVREGSNSGERELAILIDHWDNQKPLKWIKVNNLPDHVFFSHVQHVSIANSDCADCHGKVEDMHEIKQVLDMNMKWCLDCHETQLIETEGNPYYQSVFSSPENRVNPGISDSVSVKEHGGWDCMKCHR